MDQDGLSQQENVPDGTARQRAEPQHRTGSRSKASSQQPARSRSETGANPGEGVPGSEHGGPNRARDSAPLRSV